MIYIAYIAMIFLIIQFLVSLINLVFIQTFNNLNRNNDIVSILIPARNEEKNIENLLKDLISQDYKNIEILVFNDNSTDNTEKILENYSKQFEYVNYLNSDYLPSGWLGKNYACYNLAKIAKGKYFLFLDADVRINGDIINKCLNYIKDKNLALISIFPKQNMITLGEKITVPIMNYILLTLLPLIFVRKLKFISLSAANGQFMFFNADIYKKLNPHYVFKNEKVEDIKISRYYKKMRYKIACLVGKDEVSCRMYKNYQEAILGFTKNISTFFGNSYLLAFLFWFFTTIGPIIVLIQFSIYMNVVYFMLYLMVRIFVSISSNQSIFSNISLMILQQISMGHILLKSLLLKKSNKLVWKDRNIS